MNILLATSECFPYSKTGGLADMVGALAKALGADGHHVHIVTPIYRGIAEKHPTLQREDIEITVQLGTRLVTGHVWSANPAPNLKVHFIDQPEFYDRAALYGEGGHDYPDNAARFTFLSK